MNILVTGSATGFGRLTVELLSAAGHRVFATMRAVSDRNAAAAEALRRLPGVSVAELDVSSDESVTGAVQLVLREVGHLDCVVNNAGFAGFGITEGFTIDQWQRVFDTNLLGCVRLNNAVLPSMRARRSGLLIHITSIAGRVAVPYLVPYASSKWALEAYAESLRLELAPFGIDSVVVEPGKYRTEIFDKTDDAGAPGLQAEYGEANLAGRFLHWFVSEMDEMAQDPREVAQTVLRLIETPFGQRRFRTPVGLDVMWITPYNEAADEIRKGALLRMGLPELLQGTEVEAAEPAQEDKSAAADGI